MSTAATLAISLLPGISVITPLSSASAIAPSANAIAIARTSRATSDLFEAPFRVSGAKGLIDVDEGHAAPLMTDFDGDGVPDLLVGQYGDGKLRVYKNVGTAKAPKFDGFTWFKTGEEEGRVPSG